MASGQQKKPKLRKRAKASKRRSGALVAHRAFAPLLGLWGAALGALPVLVLPPALIDGAIRGTTLALLNGSAQAVIAGLSAMVLGGGLFMFAASMSGRARPKSTAQSIAAMATGRTRPIDPARDLGNRSLDDPIKTMPFATPAWRNESEHASAPAPLSQPAPQPAPPPVVSAVPEPAPSVPRALDLAAFAELPGRNAVWVEDAPEAAPVPAVTDEPQPSAPLSRLPLPEPGSAALSRLRAVPPSELSLVQMVERFAGALHEHRESAPARTLTGAELAARETALAEALKALASLSGQHAAVSAGAGESGGGNEPLRSALARLQSRRGAA